MGEWLIQTCKNRGGGNKRTLASEATVGPCIKCDQGQPTNQLTMLDNTCLALSKHSQRLSYVLGPFTSSSSHLKVSRSRLNKHSRKRLQQRYPRRRKWQPTPVFLLGNPMDREAWQAMVHRIIWQVIINPYYLISALN